jgi:hypothetical protein
VSYDTVPGGKPAQTGTKLITDSSTRPVPTGHREVDARTALCRGLAEYLQGLSLDLPGGRRVSLDNCFWQWPEAEQDAIYPALACIPEGDGEYEAKNLTPVFAPADRLKQPDGRWTFEWAELAQDIRAELHCNDPAEREGLVSLIEDAMNPVDWMFGFRLMLPHYYGQHADFQLMSTGYPDTAESVMERLRVTVFKVHANIAVVKLYDFPTMIPRIELDAGVTVEVPAVDPLAPST